MQIKNTLRFHLTLVRMVEIKKKYKSSGTDVGKEIYLFTVGGGTNWCSHYENQEIF